MADTDVRPDAKPVADAAMAPEVETGAGPAGVATERLIERFGGIRPMAAKLQIPVTTVQGWKKRGAIPASRHSDILAAAETHNITLDVIEVAATEPPVLEAAAGEKTGIASGSPQRLWTDPLLWVAVSIAAFVFAASMLVFTGLYIVKQKNADLAHRVNIMEGQLAVAVALEPRVAALEKLSREPVPSAETQGIGDAQKRVGDLASESAQIAALSQKIQDVQIASGGSGVMTQTLAGLQQTVAALQAGLQTLSQSLDVTRTKVTALDTAFNERRTENARQFALLLGIDQLRAATATSQPFEAALNTARTLSRDDQDVTKILDTLAPFAADGAPTLNELRVEFGEKATDIVRSHVVGNGGSYMRQALYQLGSVLSIRRVGSNVESTNVPETAVAHAEAKLEDDDLSGAVSSLSVLTGLPKEVAAGWVDSAQRRLAVDNAASQLADLSLQRLAALQSPAAASPGAGTP
jgi:hypothetical protein